MWKHKHMSMVGRACLINSVLSSVPFFFKIPKGVLGNLIALQNSFLWGNEDGREKISWVRWETICNPREQGGLGVKDLALFNEALLAKWKWNMFHDMESLWVGVLESKCQGWKGLGEQVDNNCEFIWWRDLLKLVCGGSEENNWFDKLVE